MLTVSDFSLKFVRLFFVPFVGRTPGSDFNTPATSISGRTNSFATPIRDKLNINAEDGIEGGETPYAVRALKDALRSGLSRLPAPRNDYEIVVPEDQKMDVQPEESNLLEDQADIDARAAAELKAKRSFIFFPLMCVYKKIFL